MILEVALLMSGLCGEVACNQDDKRMRLIRAIEYELDVNFFIETEPYEECQTTNSND